MVSQDNTKAYAFTIEALDIKMKWLRDLKDSELDDIVADENDLINRRKYENN